MVINKSVSSSFEWFYIMFGITGELEPTVLDVVCTMMWGFLV